MVKPKKYRYEWKECRKCGRPYNKNRECLVCEGIKTVHNFVEDDIIAERGLNKVEEEKQKNLDWNDFAGDFIKADNVKEFPVKFVVLGVEKIPGMDDRDKLVAEIEYGDRTWKFDLNKTNRDVLQEKFNSPSEIIGKVLKCNRIKVRNPSTQAMVWSLVIEDVE